MPDKGFEDAQMVRKKERAIDKTERKRDIRDAIQDGKPNDSYTNGERLSKVEIKTKEAEKTVDNLADESLQLAKRVVDLGRTVNHEEKRLNEFTNRVTRMEDKAKELEEETDKYEDNKTKKSDTKTRNILAVIVIIISVIAIIFTALTFMRGVTHV